MAARRMSGGVPQADVPAAAPPSRSSGSIENWTPAFSNAGDMCVIANIACSCVEKMAALAFVEIVRNPVAFGDVSHPTYPSGLTALTMNRSCRVKASPILCSKAALGRERGR